VPNNLARGMITGRSHVVGVILGGVWGKFGQYAIEGIRGVLDAHGYLPFLTIHSWSEDREQRELDMLMRMRVDGVIAMPQLMSRKDCYTSLTKQRVPEDVRIACIGDTIETVEQSAQLTAIREPVREIGRVAAELVIEAIKNPKLRPQERLVDSAELVVRPSTVGMADGPR
jgi:DNA-binding LacI/PurR family transcriptional regulator